MAPEGATPLRVAVLGPGGVGGLLAATLARGGDAITCLARSSTAQTLREHGLHLDSERFGTFSVTVTASEVLDHQVDVCFVTVKATALDASLERLPAAMVEGALLVPLLNGIDHVITLRERYPDASVVAATLRVESARTSPGRIHQVSPFARVELAADQATRADVDRVADHLARAGFDVAVRDDEVSVLWGKLAVLGPLALLTTHADASAGFIRENRRDDLVALVAEVCAVGRAEGASLDDQAVLAFIDGVPATMESSMQRDAASGRRLELDAIGGAVLRAAQRHQISVPVSSRLVDELRMRHGTV